MPSLCDRGPDIGRLTVHYWGDIAAAAGERPNEQISWVRGSGFLIAGPTVAQLSRATAL